MNKNNSVEKIIRKNGKLLKKYFYNGFEYKLKERQHLVSEFDKRINENIIRNLSKLYPNDGFISEESELIKSKNKYNWIIDPIDGTTYFIFGEPYFSISLARIKNDKVIEAHVYNPISDEYYYSDSNINKSIYNGTLIKVSTTKELYNSLIAIGYSTNYKIIKKYYNDYPKLFDDCRKGVAWICPALSICNVARGRIDAFIDMGCSYEGQAAASLILKNAGGKMYNYDKTEYSSKIIGGIFLNNSLNISNIN